MRKFCLNFAPFFIISLIVVPFVFVVSAASLSLTHIGGLATGGAQYSEWWYTQTSFTLKGTAPASASVSINIDGDTKQVTADASGNWSYAVVLSESDYDITISSGSESYSFVLHAGQSLTDSASSGTITRETTQSTSAVPPTGYSQIMGILISATLLAAGFYLFIQGRNQSKKAYVKSLLDSLE